MGFLGGPICYLDHSCTIIKLLHIVVIESLPPYFVFDWPKELIDYVIVIRVK